MSSSERVIAPNSRCRVCLTVDVRMHWIRNNHLVEVYEKLAGTKLNADDGRPHTICYICYSQLQRCCRFSDMCHKSEQLLREHLLHGPEAEEAPPIPITHNLTVTAVPGITILHYFNKRNIDLIVKEECNEEEFTATEEYIPEESLFGEDLNVNLIDSEQSLVNIKSETDFKNYNTFATVKTDTNNVCALPFCCDVCNSTFVAKTELKEHMHSHFRKQVHVCITCNKQFSYKSILQTHMRTHTGEKPYACNICNKSFSDQHILRHMRIHTGETPYACKICSKTYTRNSSLHDHMRTHTGEKPYACKICSKTYTRNSSLHYHMRTHSGE